MPGGAQTKNASDGQKEAMNSKSKPIYLPTLEMLNNVIKNFQLCGVSSLQAIGEYTAANYKVDTFPY